MKFVSEVEGIGFFWVLFVPLFLGSSTLLYHFYNHHHLDLIWGGGGGG